MRQTRVRDDGQPRLRLRGAVTGLPLDWLPDVRHCIEDALDQLVRDATRLSVRFPGSNPAGPRERDDGNEHREDRGEQLSGPLHQKPLALLQRPQTRLAPLELQTKALHPYEGPAARASRCGGPLRASWSRRASPRRGSEGAPSFERPSAIRASHIKKPQYNQLFSGGRSRHPGSAERPACAHLRRTVRQCPLPVGQRAVC